jgi:hypothetical protein
MKARILSSLIVLGMLVVPAWAGTKTAPKRIGAIAKSEAASLRAIEQPTLGALRGGLVAKTAPVHDAERGALITAQASSPDLAALRAGDVTLTDHDLTIIAIVAGVLLIILIAS